MAFSIYTYRPEIIAFFSGAAVMIFELLGARIVGSYIGTSLYVWSSLIAIILGALALGYYFGGKLADKNASMKLLAFPLLLSSLSILGLILLTEPILIYVSSTINDIRYSSIILSLILFTPTSLLLGMLTPIVTKIRLTDIHTSGSVVGQMGSIGTIGSISGTLGAGFFLIPSLGVTTLMLLLAVSCVIFSLYCEHKKYIVAQIGILMVISVIFYGNDYYKSQLSEKNQYTYDTKYSHIIVDERQEKISGRKIRDLRIDNITHAGMYMDNNDLVYPYTRYYRLFDAIYPQAKNILMLGGAAYSFPKSFLDTYPNKKIDVVEIDEEITEIAKKHFRLNEDENLNIYHQDARLFLNTTKNTYDAILGDAFGSYFSIPYQLTTLEVAQKKYDLLTEKGIVILNIISTLEGEGSQFLKAEYATYSEVFPEVFLLPVSDPNNPDISQNIMLVAMKEKRSIDLSNLSNLSNEYKDYLSRGIQPLVRNKDIILTDEYAPVDYFIAKMQ